MYTYIFEKKKLLTLEWKLFQFDLTFLKFNNLNGLLIKLVSKLNKVNEKEGERINLN